MGEWKDTPLSEVADLLPGYAFKGMDFGVGTSRGVKIKDVQSGVVAVESLDALDVTSYNQERIKKYRLNAGDHLITMTGNLGRVATIPDSPHSIYLNQRVAKLLPKANVVEDFLLYVIKSSDFIDYCITHADSETAQPNISAGTILEYEFSLPPEYEQRAIASVLSSLEAKIDLLHRQNKTLEAMAETLFRQWFVEEAEEGWEEGTLSSLGPIIMGNSPKGDSYNEVGEGVPLINGPVEYGEYFPLKSKWTTDPKRFAEAGDLIFCVRGSTTGRRVVADGNYAIGRGVCAFRSKQRMFLYQMIEAKLPELLGQTTGSVFPSLSSEDIKNFPITLPPQKLRDQYEELAGPMLEQIEANHRQCATLAALRDRLLPKLMSGEVRVEMNYQAQDH